MSIIYIYDTWNEFVFRCTNKDTFSHGPTKKKRLCIIHSYCKRYSKIKFKFDCRPWGNPERYLSGTSCALIKFIHKKISITNQLMRRRNIIINFIRAKTRNNYVSGCRWLDVGWGGRYDLLFVSWQENESDTPLMSLVPLVTVICRHPGQQPPRMPK